MYGSTDITWDPGPHFNARLRDLRAARSLLKPDVAGALLLLQVMYDLEAFTGPSCRSKKIGVLRGAD